MPIGRCGRVRQGRIGVRWIRCRLSAGSACRIVEADACGIGRLGSILEPVTRQCDRRQKAIPPPGQCLNAASQLPIGIQRAAQIGKLDREIVLLHDHIRPDGVHDLLTRDNGTTTLDQEAKDPKRAGAEGDTARLAVRVYPQQRLCRPVQQEIVEPKRQWLRRIRHLLPPADEFPKAEPTVRLA